MKICKRNILAFCLAVFSSIFLSACAKNEFMLDKNGLKFDNEQKQEYMSKIMDQFFNPPQNAPKPAPFAPPKGFIYDDFMVGDLKIERLENLNAHTNIVIFQLHGGGYVGGLHDRYRNFALKHTLITDTKEAYMLNYRLAPKHIYPSALQDAISAYNAILKRNVKPENIVIIGDSAGGNLALALSIYLKQNQIPQPRLLVLISPWADMSGDLPSRKTNTKKDVVLGEKNKFLYKEVANSPSYAGNLPLKDPRLSPLYADLSDLPPMLIQAGGYELLLDDSIELAKNLAKFGGEFSLSVYDGMPHDFALVIPNLQESINSFIEIRDFIGRYMGN